MLKNNKLIFFLDDNCIMCNRFCQFLAQRLEGIEFHSVFTPASRAALKQHGIELTEEVDSSYLWNGERFLAKSENFFYLMSKVGYPYKVLGWMSFLRHLGADRVYDVIQKNRHRLFVNQSCPITPVRIIPDKDILEIFDLEHQ